MNKISDASVIDALRRQMTIAVAKQVASAGNLANIDTPGYKAKEVTFSDALKSKLAPANSTFPGAPRSGGGGRGARARRKSRGCQRAATATTCSSIASCCRWAAPLATSPPRRRRWPRSSDWFATRSTRANNDVDAQCRHHGQRQRAQRRAHAHRGGRVEHGQRRFHAQCRRTAVPPPRRDADRRPGRTASTPCSARRSATGVKVAGIVEDQTPFRKRYEPSHPDADADGFVSLPNVDASEEMVDMLGAARAYQANLAAIGMIKDMVAKALELGR